MSFKTCVRVYEFQTRWLVHVVCDVVKSVAVTVFLHPPIYSVRWYRPNECQEPWEGQGSACCRGNNSESPVATMDVGYSAVKSTC